MDASNQSVGVAHIADVLFDTIFKGNRFVMIDIPLVK